MAAAFFIEPFGYREVMRNILTQQCKTSCAYGGIPHAIADWTLVAGSRPVVSFFLRLAPIAVARANRRDHIQAFGIQALFQERRSPNGFIQNIRLTVCISIKLVKEVLATVVGESQSIHELESVAIIFVVVTGVMSAAGQVPVASVGHLGVVEMARGVKERNGGVTTLIIKEPISRLGGFGN